MKDPIGKKLFGAMVGVALLASAGAASADEASGTIQSIDAAKRTITLDSGKNFKLDPAVTLANLRMGTKVTVSYEAKGGQNIATKVVAASAAGGMGSNPPAGNTGPAMREAPGTNK
jgi:Cu/Ag efflux protein CusF